MTPYHPSTGGANLSKPYDQAKAIEAGNALSAAILAEMANGPRCGKCGGAMAHYRLHGYRCMNMSCPGPFGGGR